MLWNADHRWGACHKPIPQVPGGHLCLSRLRLCFTSNKDALLSCGCGLGVGVVPSYAKGSPLGSLNVLWNKQDAEHSIYPKDYRCDWGLGITKLREDSTQNSQNTLVVERQPPSQSANWPLYLCVFPSDLSPRRSSWICLVSNDDFRWKGGQGQAQESSSPQAPSSLTRAMQLALWVWHVFIWLACVTSCESVNPFNACHLPHFILYFTSLIKSYTKWLF